MYVDGKDTINVYGVNPLVGEHSIEPSQIQLGLYSRWAHLMPLTDKFNPPATQSIFSDIMYGQLILMSYLNHLTHHTFAMIYLCK